MLHNGEKIKPLNCIFYCVWPVQVAIMTINFCFPEVLYMLASIFILYAASSILSFRYWSNSVWLIYFNRGTTYALKKLIIVFFLSLNSLLIKEQWKPLFTTKFFSVFDLEWILLIHAMTLSELSIYSAWIISFT